MRLQSLFAVVALAPSLIGASQPLRLQPSSQWVVDHADNSCRLVRIFGQGPDQTRLILKSIGPGDVTMTAAGNPLKTFLDAKIATRFLPARTDPFEGTEHRTTDDKPMVLWTSVPVVNFDPLHPPKMSSSVKDKPLTPSGTRPQPIDLPERNATLSARNALLAATTEMEVKPSGHSPVILELGPLDAPAASLDRCDRDLIRDEGLDPDVQEQIVRPVWTPDFARWIGPESYPLEALNRHQESSVSARLIVDAAGYVTRCVSLTPFSTPAFNQATCDTLNKAHFEPAELQNGKKVPSYRLVSIMFRIAP